MNFKITDVLSFRRKRNLLLIMKILIFFCFTVSFAFTSNSGFSQNTKILISNDSKVSVEEVFEIIKNQTDYRFAYQSNVFENLSEVTLKKGVITLNKLLQLSLRPAYDYQFDDKNNSIFIIPYKEKKIFPQEDHVVTGRITTKEGFPLMGVTVLVENKSIGVFTNEEGKYKIKVSNNDVLKFTYIGYEKKEIKVDSQQEINVVLEEALSELDEVQVTAYGKTSKRLATGNITTITSEEIRKSPVSNVLQAVQGKVPGVFIRQTSGQAGTPFDIQIRGVNTLKTINQSAPQPLLVVDGVAFPAGNLQGNSSKGIFSFEFDSTSGNGLSYINPNDIETINFLKDGDATAIYGSRGANGVILITTKKAKKGEPTVSFSTRSGYSFAGRSPKLLNTEDYINYRTEAVENSGNGIGFSDLDINGTFSDTRYTDWKESLLKSGAFSNFNSISYSGGSDNARYLVRGNYNKENSILNNSGANTLAGIHFDLSTNTSDHKFTLGLTGTYTASKNTGSIFDTFRLFTAPNAPDPYNEDGTINQVDFDEYDFINPARINEVIAENKVDNLIGNINFRYTPVKGLVFKANAGISNLSSRDLYAKPTTYYPLNTFSENSSSISRFNIKTITIEPSVSYQANLGNLGTAIVNFGATFQEKQAERSEVSATDLFSDNQLRDPAQAGFEKVSYGSDNTNSRYTGVFGILNYNFVNKYLLNLSLRRDGSTKFGAENRFATFGSVGASWILSEENWFKNNIKFIDFAKFRGSFGTVGGDGIDDYLYLSTYYTSVAYGNEDTLEPEGPSNAFLQWEHNEKSELGVNLGLFKSRIQLGYSYYTTITEKSLTDLATSAVTGVTRYFTNSPAKIKNWGHEITLSTENIKNEAFSWTTNFNITLPKSELVAFNNVDGLQENHNFVVGKPVTGIKVYNYQGVNPETGNFNFFKDLDGNGKIDDGEVDEFTFDLNDNDATEFVDLAPEFFGGIQNTFSYKNFSLGVFFSFQKRNIRTAFASEFSAFSSPGGANKNISQDVYNARWQNPGDITDIPRFAPGFFSTFAFENYKISNGAYTNVSYARLQNVNLNYNLPSKWLQKVGLKSMQIYLQGQNLLVISDFKGRDPEVIDALGPLRTFVFGLDLSL
ncbi:SusC/RagA family TonB-linked outer membrane protein [Thalassobellus citreus]|uniref:SusC/RagA family TonB-linked outer membrane protein n=1 Tax=Thalassobellus citreus TaxID=3367752 RepID=UPI00379E2053